MFGRKKKEETQEAVQYNPLQDNDSNFPMPILPSQEQQLPSFSQQPTQQFTQEQPQQFPQQQFKQLRPFPQQPKKAPQGHFKIIGGEIVENGFRYVVLSDISMKIGDDIEIE